MIEDEEYQYFHLDEVRVARGMSKEVARFHAAANPQFAGHTTTVIGQNTMNNFAGRMFLGMWHPKSKFNIPRVTTYVVAKEVLSPNVTTEVSSAGGGTHYHATPALGGGLFGLLMSIFD